KRIVVAVVHMVIEHLEAQALQCGSDGGDLGQDVDAVAVVVDHALDAAHLSLDAVEALLERLFFVAVLHQRSSLRLWKRRSRSEFETTNSDEAAIAAAATIGLSSPATASGIAATL